MRGTSPGRNFRPTRIVGTDVQQTPRPSTPAAPAAPASPTYVYDASQIAAPRTAQDVQAMRLRLSDLRGQLQDAASRRRTVSEQIPAADPVARPGLMARMNELDARILRIERDISQTQQALSAAPSAVYVAGAGMPLPDDVVSRISSDIVPIVAILSVFVLGPFAVALSRWIWKRSSAPAPRPALDTAAQQRLEQLQQSVDTIAIEIERISEGQRFVTKLLGDRALGVGSAEAILASQRQASGAREGS